MPSSRSRRFTLSLLVAAATGRLLLQVLCLAPYAGLDEAYHVVRVAFVVQEGRQPSSTEPSLPRYLATSMAGAGDALPAFGMVGPGWPELLAAHPGAWVDVPLSDREPERVYVSTNYEAQQPSLYYAGAARLVRVLGTTQRRELLVLRLLAVAFGVAVIVATGLLAASLWGEPGLVAGLLVVLTPTWLTLVALAPWRSAPGRWTVRLLAAAALLYAIAEVGHDFGFVREALVKGLPAPTGVLAGWYVLSYVPIWFAVGLGFVLASASPGARGALVVWAVAWDAVIHEGALFCDYAGLSSPLAPGFLFRWGGGTPWEALATLHARGLAEVTPGSALLLRLLVVAATLGLVHATREEEGGAAVAAPPG